MSAQTNLGPGSQFRKVTLAGLALLLYAGISFAYFSTTQSWSRSIFGHGGDPFIFVWCIHWWTFAVVHGLNPFISHYVWYPAGYNLTWTTSVPSAALFTSPITLLFGPVLSFNLFSVLTPAFGAWTMFLLGQYLARDWAASLIGGYLYGFSSYELSQLLGHLHADVVFVAPLVVLLCVAYVRQDLGRVRFIAALALLLLAELGFSTEVLATLCAFGAVAWAIFFAFAPAVDRGQFRRMAVDSTCAVIAMAVLAIPFAVYIVKGLTDVPPEINSAKTYSADLLNFVLPTKVTGLGHSAAASISERFTGNAAEQGAYLGVPLVLLCVLYFRSAIARPYVKALLAITALLVVMSLGPWLQIGGAETGVPLPWFVVSELPLLHFALPTRFTMYVSLCASVVAVLWLATPSTGKRRIWRFALAGFCCLLLVPNLAVFTWQAWPSEPFFTPEHVRDVLGPTPNVLILPSGLSEPELGWQLDANMAFTQSGGHLTFWPKGEEQWADVLSALVTGQIEDDFGHDLAVYCAAHHVDFILMGPGTPEPIESAIGALGWQEHDDSGVLVVRVPASVGPAP